MKKTCIFTLLAAWIGILAGCDGPNKPNTESNTPDTIASGKDGSEVTEPNEPSEPNPQPDGTTNPDPSTQPDGIPDGSNTPDQTRPEPPPEKGDPNGLGVTKQALSGARLKIRFIQGADGSKQFLGWHDTMLNTPCSWRPAKSFDATFSNKSYCVPDNMLQGLNTSSFFTDSNCTQPLFQKSVCIQSDLYGLTYGQVDGLFCTTEVFCYGVTPYKDEALYFKDANAGCLKTSINPNDIKKNGALYKTTGRCTEQSFFAQYAEGEVKIEP